MAKAQKCWTQFLPVGKTPYNLARCNGPHKANHLQVGGPFGTVQSIPTTSFKCQTYQLGKWVDTLDDWKWQRDPKDTWLAETTPKVWKMWLPTCQSRHNWVVNLQTYIIQNYLLIFYVQSWKPTIPWCFFEEDGMVSNTYTPPELILLPQ